MRLPALSTAIFLLLGPAALAAAANDLDDTFQRLKEAQLKNDPVNVKKLAAELHGLARQSMAAPAPADAENDAVSNRIANAKAADLFSEYALFATAIQSEPATLIDLISTLEQQNPKSKYLDDAYGPYLVALSRTNQSAKATAVAEKALANFPENEDVLLLMVDTALTRKQSDRALGYANRLVSVLGKHPKPENLPAADWERKRSLALAHGYWTAGVVSAEKGQYMAADKNLRAALPLIKGNNAMLGPALFHLGMANYQLGKMTASKARVLDAARFSQEAAGIEGPYADQARHNALVMKAEAAKM